MPRYIRALSAAALCAVFFTVQGCSGPAEDSPRRDVVIRVNDYTLTAKEFDDLFRDFGPRKADAKAKAEFLKNLITRKLLLQEGQKLGLDKDRDFLMTVENFWEQSLLQLVISEKMRTLAGQVNVTDADVEEYYRNWKKANPEDGSAPEAMRRSIRLKILKAKQDQALDKWINALKSRANIKVDKKALDLE